MRKENTMNEDLLLEIGTEEIPAGYLLLALEQLKELAKSLLEEEMIVHKTIQTFGTPRRLALYVQGVALHQQDLVTEVMGPPKHVSFDAEGKHTQAAIGFARAQGVKVEDLQTKQTSKGDYILAVKTLQGKETKEVLVTLLPKIITSLIFPKSMYWQSKNLYFARPIRWILALLGEAKIEFELGKIKSDNHTFGHRFLSKQPIKINHPAEYEEKLRENYCLVNQVKRQEMIMEAINSYCQKNGCLAPETEELLNEVVYLVEYPYLIVGSFDKEYLQLPKEVLVAAMREHQRYFHTTDKEGRFLPDFLIIANTNPEADSIRNQAAHTINTIREGNERVLRARLADASFFFVQDKKIPLEARVEQEKDRVWQEDVGTIYEKTQRVVKLAEFISSKIAKELIPKAVRAALLCKADLSTEMVGEFPKLQGIMGYYYATADGEDEDVAKAIRQHYLPTSADGVLPETLVSAIVSLADKIDSIVACFSVGLIPTGSQDPYALRRQAQGIINILSAGFLKIPSTPSIPPLSLQELVDYSLNLLAEKAKRKRETVSDEVLNFLSQRLQNTLINGLGSGIYSHSGLVTTDQALSLLAVGGDDITDVWQRALAYSEFAKTNEFEPVSITFKRVMNILKPEDRSQKSEVKQELLVDEAEKTLYALCLRLKEELDSHLVKKDYSTYLSTLTQFRQPIDNFFDKVMVMAEDKNLRENRLALLDNIAGLFLKIARF